MKIKNILDKATKELKDSCDRPFFEAQLLLSYFLKQERIYLIINIEKTLKDIDGFWVLINRRANNEPYEYIVGEVSFYDIDLKINKGVLIPRPETELLIDLVADIIEQEGIYSIAEIGIGSGAISIILARKFPALKIIATDISTIPLILADKNISNFNLSSQIELRKSNLLDEVSENLELVVSNPPYIAENFILQSNIVDYEPKEALFGGEIGDEILKQIIVDVALKGVKYLVCEMGYNQKESISKFIKQFNIKYIKFYQDLSNFDRGFIIKFK